jgi:hypothetical protein
LIARPGLFTSLFLLVLTLLFVVNPVVPPSARTIVLFVPALILAMFFNPVVWGLAWLLYNLVGSIISALVGYALGGPIGAGVSLVVSVLAISIAFLTKVVPLIIGAVYALAIGPLLFLLCASVFGVLPSLFVLYVLYYFVFGGKYIPYLLGALVAEAIIFGYVVAGMSAERLYYLVAGMALLFFGAAVLGVAKRATGIRDAFARVAYLYLLARLGIRAGSVAYGGIAGKIDQLLDALAGVSFGLLAPAGIILFLLVLGLFSGKRDIPDNLMKILALYVLVTLSFPPLGLNIGEFIGVTYPSEVASASGYYDEMVQTADRIFPGSSTVINTVVSPIRGALPSAVAYGGGYYGGGTHYITLFQGENLGGTVEQPQPSGTAPTAGERWGVEVGSNATAPSLSGVTDLLGKVFASLGSWSVLASSVLILGFAYVMDVMAGTAGMDVFSGIFAGAKSLRVGRAEVTKEKAEIQKFIEESARTAVKEYKAMEAAQRLATKAPEVKEAAAALPVTSRELAERLRHSAQLSRAAKVLKAGEKVSIRLKKVRGVTGEERKELVVSRAKKPGFLGRIWKEKVTIPLHMEIQKRAEEIVREEKEAEEAAKLAKEKPKEAAKKVELTSRIYGSISLYGEALGEKVRGRLAEGKARRGPSYLRVPSRRPPWWPKGPGFTQFFRRLFGKKKEGE